MRTPAPSRHPKLGTRHTTTTLVAFATFLSYACGGCLSNEYVIPKSELGRLASLPPEQRGQSVRVVQSLGDRRADAIDTSQPPQPQAYTQDGYASQEPPPDGYVESGPSVGVGVIIAPVPPPLIPPLPGVGHGGPGPRGPMVGAPGRPLPPPRPAPPARSGGKAGTGGGGGGGGGKDDLVVFVVVVALLATVGMIATEGVRYDGTVAVYPWQGVHLKDVAGQEREVPLAQLTQADVASTAEAKVMDDEGWGMMRLGRAPLNRQGFSWKMNLGILHSTCSCLNADGVAADIQFGYFPHSMVGILANWSPGGGSDSDDRTFSRHNLSLEAQFFPLSVWRLHLGGFGHAGIMYAKQYQHDAMTRSTDGPAFGGGAMLELSLTTRLALTARFDYTSAKIGIDDQLWQGAETFTMGIAIY